MLVIENNCVYEIDEECLAKRAVAAECGTAQKAEEMRKKKDEIKSENHK